MLGTGLVVDPACRAFCARRYLEVPPAIMISKMNCDTLPDGKPQSTKEQPGKVTMKRTLLSWSSGKDSAWSLHVVRQQNEYEIVGLLTTFNQEANGWSLTELLILAFAPLAFGSRQA